jgi:hypothetical protein
MKDFPVFVNVFTPKLPAQEDQDERLKGQEARELLPVMFYIYGGGYYVGGGDLYGGKYLVDQDVILVTFNYVSKIKSLYLFKLLFNFVFVIFLKRMGAFGNLKIKNFLVLKCLYNI